ncbi:MAG: M14-type cytosolic carboxypeptidase [Myxococcota bacterium]
MHISSAFDSGNIVVLDGQRPEDVTLEIRPDAGEDHFQWFHFRVTGARDTPLRLRIVNAARVSYPDGWTNYRACASYDREDWFRVNTRWDGKELTIEHTPELDSVYYAYFAPYSHERHGDLLAAAQCEPGVSLERLGASVDGRDLDLLRLGEPADGQRSCWIIARQHPGETMAQWLVEGLLERLLDDDDAIARWLRARATFYVVPNMNPDGSARGHLRNNAAGANLNREWQTPSMERSPEVFLVRERMQTTGVDFFLDVHGDEALPYNFIAGPEGIPSWSDATAARQRLYTDALLNLSPDFQTTHGYPPAKPGEANMTMASNWVGEAFGCLSMTLEQPFKDTADTPHPQGWSPERARQLGYAQLGALRVVFDALR